MQVNIQIKNLPQIRAAFLKAPRLMARELGLAIKKSTIQVGRQSQINTPVKTGRLRASHQYTFTPTQGIVRPTANYAIFVHEGTRFMKGRPFLASAVESEDQIVQGFFKEAVDNVFKNISRSA